MLQHSAQCSGTPTKFLIGLKRTLDQNLSSGSMLVILMINHFFLFRFADPEHC